MNTYPLLRGTSIQNKRVLVRVDFDVPTHDGTITDDARIVTNIPTLKKLLDGGNRLILMAKRGRPTKRDTAFSLAPIADVLSTYLPESTCQLIPDFRSEPASTWTAQTPHHILLLENTRFFDEDTTHEHSFLTKLCSLADVYINDAFAMAHRDEFDITSIPQHLPSYAGLSLETEVSAIMRVIAEPRKPCVAIIGGAKIETKVEPIKKLMDLCDSILVGGGIANTFLKAHGYDIQDSLYDERELKHAQSLIDYASDKPVALVLPTDVRIGDPEDENSTADCVSVSQLPPQSHILDIGPRTQEIYADIIHDARTLLWNGPMGLFEHPAFRHGTDAIYRAIVHNRQAYSLVGGGDTLGALARKHQVHEIDHLCTGGGAMLSLIEHGDLPALQALRASSSNK